jgi:hypothetical protein
MADIWGKKTILARNLNSGLSYLITTEFIQFLGGSSPDSLMDSGIQGEHDDYVSSFETN